MREISFNDAIKTRVDRRSSMESGITDSNTEIRSSDVPRGLAISSLRVKKAFDRRPWFLSDPKNDIYFTTLAFDLSENEPLLLPPKEFKERVQYQVPPGETIEFSLGDGLPVAPPRIIYGSLLVYVLVMDSDKAGRAFGEKLAKVHDDVTSDGGLLDKLKDLVKNPGKTIVEEALAAGTALLQPLASVLKENGDDFVALFQGMFSVTESWEGRLSEEKNGTRITFAEAN